MSSGGPRPPDSIPAAATFYESTIAQAEGIVARADRTRQRVEVARVLLVLAIVATWLVRDSMPTIVAWAGIVSAIAAFALAVRYHGQLRRTASTHRRRLFAARAGHARVHHAWQDMPASRVANVDEGWPAWIAHDLDLTGEHSLARLVDITSMGGLQKLTSWMLGDPAPTAEIVERQQSVRDLRERNELLLQVAADSRFAGGESHATLPESFLVWCRSPSESETRHLRRLAVLPVAFIGIELVLVFSASAFATPLAYLFAVANIVIANRAQRRLRANTVEFERALGFLRSTQRLFEQLVRAAPLQGRLGDIQQQVASGGALDALHRLLHLLEWAAVRHSPMVHWVLNALFAFDVHVAHRLSAWRTRHASHIPTWLDDAGEAGALFALGTLAYEHPSWTAPVVHDDASLPRLDAAQLIHPLLPVSKAVPNDANLTHAGDAIVVSGANMAGKSTYLRAIGLNVLLAQAGSMVAAESFHLHRCRLRSSVRVEDDLGSGVSLFLAEVTRVKQVIDEARDDTRSPVLYLLDEVLHGTNATDRREASQRVLANLRSTQAVGVIATHDPVIGSSDASDPFVSKAPGTPRQIHFACRVTPHPANGQIELVFDYRAKPGPAQESNALAILDLLFGDA